MNYDLVGMKIVGDYRIQLIFADQTQGVVDFREYINRGGVFARLMDPDIFNRAYIDPDWAVIRWGNDLDIASETLYNKVKGGH